MAQYTICMFLPSADCRFISSGHVLGAVWHFFVSLCYAWRVIMRNTSMTSSNGYQQTTVGMSVDGSWTAEQCIPFVISSTLMAGKVCMRLCATLYFGRSLRVYCSLPTLLNYNDFDRISLSNCQSALELANMKADCSWAPLVSFESGSSFWKHCLTASETCSCNLWQDTSMNRELEPLSLWSRAGVEKRR